MVEIRLTKWVTGAPFSMLIFAVLYATSDEVVGTKKSDHMRASKRNLALAAGREGVVKCTGFAE